LLASAETQLIDLLQVAGIDAHPAVAGEFTARAFLNGRISLLEAEYVAASIAARNHNELKAADHLRKNPIIKRTALLIESMRNILGRLEASIDFSDEADVVAITGTALGSEVQGVVDDLDALLEGRLGGEAPQELPRVVLAGPPNAGKSTLFNRLLDRSRVVVSSQPGTTRDAPAERVSLGKRDVILVDTAGLQESLPTDGIDGAAQKATHRALAGASLIVHCTPVDVPVYPLNLLTDAPILAIRTKADVQSPLHCSPDELAISAKSGEGVTLLGAKIAELLARAPDEALLASTTLLPRHQRELAAARAAAAEAIKILYKQPEVVAELLRTSLDHLAALEGGSDPEAVLDVVFSSFCIGK
jgi:tRNA modification GTPase